MNNLNYLTYLTYLTYLILFDLESSHYFTGRAAKFLMENDMETASLENERLRTQLKECQDALEAQTSQVQAKDCRITQLQATVLVTKSDVSRIMAKHKSVRKTLKTLKESHATLIEGINVLTDNFDPVTGGPVFDAAETLHWLTRTGGVRDIKQANRLDPRCSPR